MEFKCYPEPPPTDIFGRDWCTNPPPLTSIHKYIDKYTHLPYIMHHDQSGVLKWLGNDLRWILHKGCSDVKWPNLHMVGIFKPLQIDSRGRCGMVMAIYYSINWNERESTQARSLLLKPKHICLWWWAILTKGINNHSQLTTFLGFCTKLSWILKDLGVKHTIFFQFLAPYCRE